MSPLKEFDRLRIPLQDIVSATNNFDDKHMIGKGGSGNVYEGQLLQQGQLIDVDIKRLDRKYGYGGIEFWTEIATLVSLKHTNIVSIVGFCDEAGEKIIVNKYQVNGSLENNLSNRKLTWLQRLHICLGVARALSYIHYDTGRGYDVIHRTIASSQVLLDGNWDAKVSGFGFSKIISATRRHRLVLEEPLGIRGYVDPVYAQTGTVTHKSDVYSFGVVLFEVLCGRRADLATGTYQPLALLARHHYEEGKLDDIIDPHLKNQMHPQSLKIFSDTAYHCLKEHRAERPDMEKVAKRLEKAWELQRKHENPAHLKPPADGTSPNNLKGLNLDHMKIPLSDIERATESFSTTYCIGSGGYGMVYRAELDHFDRDSPTEIEGKSKSEFPRRRSTVAIKRIRADGQGEQSFYSEIALLTRCKHPNVVSLLGFCDDGAQLIVVYEHASHGSLDDYLGNTDKMFTFPWMQRIQVCLDIANGLNYLHSTTEEKPMIVHRDIKSANILLGMNWKAKIADFGLSRIQQANNQASTLNTCNIAGTEVYLDPEYLETGKLRKESDIYSFGVVLFEILCGRLAYDKCYSVGNDKGLPSTVRRLQTEKILKEIVDPRLMEHTDMNSFYLNRGPNQDSLDAFLKIAYQCLAETRAKRPTMGIIIAELEKALYFQENNKDMQKIPLDVIKLATQNFSGVNVIGGGGFGRVYKGEITHANQHHVIAAKRLDGRFGQGEAAFLKELEILLEYKHDNVIGLVGYCDEFGEKIIVYEYAAHISLDHHLSSTDLTWMKRLKICNDVAIGLEFFHGGVVTQDVVIHRDMKSANILLTVDWKAKISDFGLSLICPINQEMDYVIDHAAGTHGYLDPLYLKSGFLTKESDMYSFGVVLFEILCGRPAYDKKYKKYGSLIGYVREYIDESKLEDIIFEDIKEQIVPESLTTYSRIAFQCLHQDREKRPTAGEVVLQLKKALELQEDHEIWEPKLPKDYKKIIGMSKSPGLYSAISKKDLYIMLCKGVLLQDGKVWFSLGTNGVRNEMISANFSYKNHRSHRGLTIPESRFPKVAEITDISKLKSRVKIRTQFLSPGVNYGVYLVFKFCGSRKSLSTPMFVNLTYKMGKETLHSYFATWRDEEWMMIELFRFLNHKNEYDFKIQLESFSRYYCKSRAIYVEGFEFRTIGNVKREEVNRLKEVQQVSKSKLNSDELTLLRKAELIKHPMISAKGALFDSSNVKLFDLNSSRESRFPEEIQLLSQQVLHIKCKMTQNQLLPNTEYACYIVFKLSEKCGGLHCPVIVRNLLRWKSKEVGILYFRSPSPWNLRDDHQVPEKREDGWMEVLFWKSNSSFEPRSDYIPINLKLIVYEGTLSGLIVRDLEFRSM